jgi:pantoate--beta-alanine ligase
MKRIHSIPELRAQVAEARNLGHSIGFVPTMGNLHAGHMALVKQAKEACGFVVTSIFVNPLQFNEASDLQRYPRTLESDCTLLETEHCDLMFAPDADEMYPNGQPDMSLIHVPQVSEGLCGGSRPGHFDGVSTVVTKLFNMVLPDVAFFGEKDFQQVAVVRKMVEDLNQPVAIRSVPTARAADGLALSSRNGYLTPAERALAPGLYQTLQEVAELLKKGEQPSAILPKAIDHLNQRGFQTDYLEVRSAVDLSPISIPQEDEAMVILGAAWLGSARLIDNMTIILKSN